jgi:hypothetical protein
MFAFKHLPAFFNTTWVTNANRRGKSNEEIIVLRNQGDYSIVYHLPASALLLVNPFLLP